MAIGIHELSQSGRIVSRPVFVQSYEIWYRIPFREDIGLSTMKALDRLADTWLGSTYGPVSARGRYSRDRTYILVYMSWTTDPNFRESLRLRVRRFGNVLRNIGLPPIGSPMIRRIGMPRAMEAARMSRPSLPSFRLSGLGQTTLTPGLIKGPRPGVVVPETTIPEGGGTPYPSPDENGYYDTGDTKVCEESFLRKTDCSLKPVPIVGGMVALGIVAGLLLRQG